MLSLARAPSLFRLRQCGPPPVASSRQAHRSRRVGPLLLPPQQRQMGSGMASDSTVSCSNTRMRISSLQGSLRQTVKLELVEEAPLMHHLSTAALTLLLRQQIASTAKHDGSTVARQVGLPPGTVSD